MKSALEQLQCELINTHHWSDTRPTEQALSSRQPFCVDTLSFAQWLQFIFLPKMAAMIEAKQPLPRLAKGQGISPMAEEFFKSADEKLVVNVIHSIDNLLVAD